MTALRPRIIPTPFNAFFWEGARDEKLLIQQCDTCRVYHHPPLPVCPSCGGRKLTASEVSGKGRVNSFTVVRHVFHQGFADQVPYVVGRIELVEQKDLYLITNILECPPEDLYVGMAVHVVFEHREEGSLPQFAADAEGGAA